MVARSRVLWIALLMGMMPHAAWCAQPSLQLTIEPGPLEYGKAIYADLKTNILNPDLGTLDLSSLDRDFLVATPDSAVLDGRHRRQDWRILLYPRRPGPLHIPALRFHGGRTKARTLVVGPAMDRSHRAPIEVSTRVSDTSVWLDQPVHVTMQVDSDSRYAWLASAGAQQDGVDIVSRPATRQTIRQAGRERTRRRISWLLYPQTTGTISIQLPQVEYHHQGLITHRFYPPRVTLHVRALPAFVPPTLPIGHMGLDVSLARRWFLFRHQLRFITLRIQSAGPPGQRPSSVLRQLRSGTNITFYPPREMAGEAAARSDASREVSYQVPFAAKSLGRVALPQIRLQYFDPASGKIETHTQALGDIVVIDPWMAYAGILALLWIVYVVGKTFYRQGTHRYRAYIAYRDALRMLHKARTPQEIKAALTEMARGEHWPANLTLAMWREKWSLCHPRLSFVSERVQRLQAALYGRSETPVNEIRHGLVDACYRRMPLLKLDPAVRTRVRREDRERV